MPDPEEVVEEALSEPKRVRGDQGEVENHSLKDKIEAARFLRSESVAENPHRAIRFARIKPPGAT